MTYDFYCKQTIFYLFLTTFDFNMTTWPLLWTYFYINPVTFVTYDLYFTTFVSFLSFIYVSFYLDYTTHKLWSFYEMWLSFSMIDDTCRQCRIYHCFA